MALRACERSRKARPVCHFTLPRHPRCTRRVRVGHSRPCMDQAVVARGRCVTEMEMFDKLYGGWAGDGVHKWDLLRYCRSVEREQRGRVERALLTAVDQGRFPPDKVAGDAVYNVGKCLEELNMCARARPKPARSWVAWQCEGCGAEAVV
jgi:hypothetical protein